MPKKPIRDGFHLSNTRRNLPMNLLRLRERIMNEFRPMLHAHDVTEQQWRVLRVLQEAEELDARDVAERACILAPSLSRILKTLTARGLIETARDSSDGRRTMIRLSADGNAFIERLTPESAASYARIEKIIGAGRMAELIDALAETLDLLDEAEES